MFDIDICNSLYMVNVQENKTKKKNNILQFTKILPCSLFYLLEVFALSWKPLKNTLAQFQAFEYKVTDEHTQTQLLVHTLTQLSLGGGGYDFFFDSVILSMLGDTFQYFGYGSAVSGNANLCVVSFDV